MLIYHVQFPSQALVFCNNVSPVGTVVDGTNCYCISLNSGVWDGTSRYQQLLQDFAIGISWKKVTYLDITNFSGS